MNLLYPNHYNALEKANLAPDIPPSFKEILNIIETSDELKKNKEKKRPNKNDKYFFVLVLVMHLEVRMQFTFC